MITATLRSTGGSVMLTLPRKLLEVTRLVVGSQVEIEVDGDRLVLSPLKKPKYRLDDLLAQCEDDTFNLDDEWLDAPAVGDEAL
ncbi:MAG: AbrB/MazE/SpoVT family DNA-binding domain-containing protein [Candidatus Competibacteraceae bacterium]|jgi:antitoxin ChpS|nr:AbrB/MazE/SpoVT family DNA-binding domain-containing protein [Candidatus Competibacteraceae bacterium]